MFLAVLFGLWNEIYSLDSVIYSYARSYMIGIRLCVFIYNY